MGDWFRVPSDLSGLGRSSGFGGFGERAVEFEPIPVELIGVALRAEGCVDIAKGARFSDYVNILVGFFLLKDAMLLDPHGRRTRVHLNELRVRLDDIAVVAQKGHRQPPPPPDMGHIVKKPRRLVLMSEAHVIHGSAYLHEEASLTDFVDATDPRFLPMTDVRVRSLADRELAGRFPFALIQRSHIIGVATGRGASSRDTLSPRAPGGW